MIFAIDYANDVPINLNSNQYKSWFFLFFFFFSDYISNMTMANSKASAPLAFAHILPRFSIS